MGKVYFVRHQAAGVVHSLPFAVYPSDKQVDAVKAICEAAHGASHPKTEEPYWANVVEVTVLGAKDVPAVPEPVGLRVAESVGVVGEIHASGFGTVTPPRSGG